jgi:hypothetical protein
LQKDNQFAFLFSSLFAGLSMGLLLGLIMGLSISPTTKIVMGVLAAGLGTFLGFDKSAFKGTPNNENKPGRAAFLRELRVGSFGFAVVAGILLGLTIRTNELLSPTIVESVEKWTEAGYSPAVARRFVALERLRIDPKTGEVREITEVDKSRISALFGSEEKIALSQMIAAEDWARDMDGAIIKARMLDLNDLENLLITINNNAPVESHQHMLASIKNLARAVEGGDKLACALAAKPSQWRHPAFAEISLLLLDIQNLDEREALAKATRTLLCNLEASQ